MTDNHSLTGSFLKRDESEAIKGALMLLIVMGHNMCFTLLYEKYQLMTYLYQFHIQAFFALPFLYDVKKLDFNRLNKYFARLYIPFIIFATLLYAGYYVIYRHNSISFSDLFQLLFFGENFWIKEYTGLQLLWFLPAMFSLSILKDFYYESSLIVKSILILISLSFYLIICFFNLYNPDYFIITNIFRYLPFGLTNGLAYLILGLIIREIISISKDIDSQNIFKAIFWAAFVAFSVLYFVKINNGGNIGIVTSLMPFSFFLLVYVYKKGISKSGFLKMIGRQSFIIYIFHTFIGYALYAIVNRYFTLSILWAIISWILMLMGSYCIAIFFNNHKRLKSILFPTSVSDYCSLFSKIKK